jgi:hypothetical protein
MWRGYIRCTYVQVKNAPRPSAETVLVNSVGLVGTWGEPGPPTAVPDMPVKLGPCIHVTVHAEAAPSKVCSRRPYTPNLRYLFQV